MQEVYNRVNELVFDNQVSLNATKKKIPELFTFTTEQQQSAKLIVISNLSSANIYYSSRLTATTANAGGIIARGNQREISLYDLRRSPYFFTDGSSVDMRLEVWQ